MVLKSASVLSCLLPSRLGFGSNHRPDPHACIEEKHLNDKRVAQDPLVDTEFDPFRGDPLLTPIPRPDVLRTRANTVPTDSLPSPLLIPNGGVGESPSRVHHSLLPPVRPKRSSFTTFFAFSSKRRSTHGAPVIHLQQDHLLPPQAIPGRWMSDGGQTHVHIINSASIPSPLRTEEEEYYYSFYSPLTPISPSHPASPNPDGSPSKQRQQDLIGNPASRPSSPVDVHPSHTQFRHPYAYSTPLHSKPYPKIVDGVPPLRHAFSQPIRHHPQSSRTDVNAGIAYGGTPSSHLGHEAPKYQPHPSQSHIRASISTPNLPSGSRPPRLRSLLRKKPPTASKRQERWLSAESWWDALFSPSPRFKVQRASRSSPATDSIVDHPVSEPVQPELTRNTGVTFPSTLAARPRAVSVTSATSHRKPTLALLRSRSAVDLSGQRSASTPPHAGFEPALETLVDEPTPPPDRDIHLPEPPLSLEQVLDEGEAFEQQRAQWKQQAYKSLGNKHTRTFSRARSKSLGEKHARVGHHRAAESNKAQLNLGFLAARTLLGSQSTMPIVHVTKPSNSSSHPKAYSHSHSQSAHSHSHSSHSRVYSHSHSHSLTTSNSSKSSHHLPSRTHFRNTSWGKTAFWKAGSLCGFGQDESCTTDDKVPSSSRVDVQGIVHIGGSANAEGPADVAKDSPSPNGEVGIAISSSPPPEGSFDLDASGSPQHEGDRESRWSSKHTHKSSEYAGPHPSAIDSNLPPLGGTSDISLRHRLPPRAIHPPIAPIAHPYRSATTHSEPAGNKGSKDAIASEKVTEGQVELSTGSTPHPHISLSHADFEQYGVGEALVYASLPRPKQVPETKGVDAPSQSSPAAGLSSPQEQSPPETTMLQSDRRDSSSPAMNSVPSLTGSTIQMVMSAFENPDDLDEFQDLFYKPHSASGSQHQELGVPINQVPTDVQGSPSSSPLTHLVRKLSEEVHSRRGPSRTPSDSIIHQRRESQDHPASASVSKFVFTDLARPSSSPLPGGSTSQLYVPIEEGDESTAQPVLVIPEDVNSFYTSSVSDVPLDDHDNDTFGYSVKHGHFEAVTSPEPVRSPTRHSTHLSIQEDTEDDAAFMNPVTKRYGLVSIDAVRASYVTTSDVSQMSGLSDFPLPPSARPVSILQAYFEGSSSPSPSPPPGSGGHGHGPSGDKEEIEMGHAHRRRAEADGEPSGDVQETLRALRTPRVASYESRRSTFGGSDDMEFITRLHQAGP